MKANRRFRKDEDAVSPVIAVILMVAITVVLAATVYVWVSGFGSSGNAARSISLSKTQSGSIVTYTVASAASGLKWSDMRFEVTGATTAYQILTSASAASTADASILSSTATLTPAATSLVTAGQRVYVTGGSTAIGGLTLNVIDVSANSLIVAIPGGTTTAATAAGATDLFGSTTSCVRYSGTAGTFTAGSTKCTLDLPIDMDPAGTGGQVFALADLTLDNAHIMGSSTIQVLSPTSFLINWGGTSTAATGDVLTLASGGVNDMTGAATTGASTVTLTASM